MFTGLVEATGKLLSMRSLHGGVVVELSAPFAGELAIGDSVAVDGVCLTAETFTDDRFTVTAGRETLALTTLGELSVGDRVNLERALAVGDRLGGHLVSGHVDGLARVEELEQQGESLVVWLSVPRELARYIATKGSVTLDGVSLTVNEVDDLRFRVNLIPHTAEVTTLGSWRAGGAVNVEVDVLARYVERLLHADSEGLSLDRLARLGFSPTR